MRDSTYTLVASTAPSTHSDNEPHSSSPASFDVHVDMHQPKAAPIFASALGNGARDESSVLTSPHPTHVVESLNQQHQSRGGGGGGGDAHHHEDEEEMTFSDEEGDEYDLSMHGDHGDAKSTGSAVGLLGRVKETFLGTGRWGGGWFGGSGGSSMRRGGKKGGSSRRMNGIASPTSHSGTSPSSALLGNYQQQPSRLEHPMEVRQQQHQHYHQHQHHSFHHRHAHHQPLYPHAPTVLPDNLLPIQPLLQIHPDTLYPLPPSYTPSVPPITPLSTADFLSILTEVQLAISRGICPTRISKGSSGSYFCRNTKGEIVGVFKPKNEEPYGNMNPKWTKWLHKNLFPCCFGRSCLIPNLGYLSEAAASYMDRRLGLNVVPRTEVVALSSPTFFYPAAQRWAYRIKGEALPPKLGSFQIFLKGFKDATTFFREGYDKALSVSSLPDLSDPTSALPNLSNSRGEMGSSSSTLSLTNPSHPCNWSEQTQREFQYGFERLVVLDYLIRNTDRGMDNWMIQYDPPVKQEQVESRRGSWLGYVTGSGSGLFVSSSSSSSTANLAGAPLLEELASESPVDEHTFTGSPKNAPKVDGDAQPTTPTITVAAIDNGLAFPFKHPDRFRLYPYAWSFLPIAKIPFSSPTSSQALHFLTSPTWWKETLDGLEALFRLDPDFSEAMWKRQKSVIRGQGYNLCEVLRRAEMGDGDAVGGSPFGLVRRPVVAVFEEDLDEEDGEDGSLSGSVHSYLEGVTGAGAGAGAAGERLRSVVSLASKHATNATSPSPPPPTVPSTDEAKQTLFDAGLLADMSDETALKLSMLFEKIVKARRGDLASCVSVLEILQKGSGELPPMPEESFEMLQVAARWDHSPSQLALGEAYMNGSQVAKDDYLALGWLVASCRSAQTQSQETTSSVALSVLLLTSPSLPSDLSVLTTLLLRNREGVGYEPSFFPLGSSAILQVWEMLALQGHAEAMFELADLWATGEEVPEKNTDTAAYWYFQSAQKGCWKSLAALANAYETGLGSYIPLNPSIANQLLKLSEAAEKGSLILPDQLPPFPSVPEPPKLKSMKPPVVGNSGSKFNPPYSKEECEKAVLEFLHGSHDTVRALGKKKMVEFLKDKEVETDRLKAAGGDTSAMVRYAKAIDYPTEKLDWLERAAQKGDATAMVELYQHHMYSDSFLAMDYLRKATNLRDPQACFLLGSRYEEGSAGSPRSYDMAYEFYMQAKNHPEALFKASALVQEGKVQNVDPQESKALLTQAIVHGHLPACLTYGSQLSSSPSPSEPVKGRLPPTLPASRFIERATDHGSHLLQSKDTKAQHDFPFRKLLETHGKEIITEARAGDLNAQMELGYILKSLGLQGMAAVVFFGNLASNNPDAQYEVARAFHLGIGDIKRHLLKACCWYFDAARNGKGSASVLSLLALADLFRKGATDVGLAGVSYAFPKNLELAERYSAAAQKLLEGKTPDEIPVPKVPIDVEVFLKGEKEDDIRNNVTTGILKVGEIEALLQAFPEGQATLGRGAGRGKSGQGAAGDGGEYGREDWKMEASAAGMEMMTTVALPSDGMTGYGGGGKGGGMGVGGAGDETFGKAGCCIVM
ncbi:phosphatidyl inositol kinase [Chytridiales sp. JEL 0842]|nr:phosphatidyl inositol kinase [Chytridiales sp. JEL 0842]